MLPMLSKPWLQPYCCNQGEKTFYSCSQWSHSHKTGKVLLLTRRRKSTIGNARCICVARKKRDELEFACLVCVLFFSSFGTLHNCCVSPLPLALLGVEKKKKKRIASWSLFFHKSRVHFFPHNATRRVFIFFFFCLSVVVVSPLSEPLSLAVTGCTIVQIQTLSLRFPFFCSSFSHIRSRNTLAPAAKK